MVGVHALGAGSCTDLIRTRVTCNALNVTCTAGPGPRTKLFKACSGALRFDIQLALFLLPYLVQNVVSYGSDEARSDVRKEARRSIMRPEFGPTHVMISRIKRIKVYWY